VSNVIGIMIGAVLILLGLTLLVTWLLVWQGRLTDRLEPVITAVGLYWFFVVGIWPILYALVYLW